MPLFQGLSRIVMAEYGTAVLVVMFMYFLFTKPPSIKRAVSLGVIVGLGLLEKVLFPAYILGPFLWGFVLEFSNRKKGSRFQLLYLWLLTLGILWSLQAPGT